MKVLAENQGKTYGAIAVDAPGNVVSPFAGNLFPCIIWDHDGSFQRDSAHGSREAFARRGLPLHGLRRTELRSVA